MVRSNQPSKKVLIVQVTLFVGICNFKFLGPFQDQRIIAKKSRGDGVRQEGRDKVSGGACREGELAMHSECIDSGAMCMYM